MYTLWKQLHTAPYHFPMSQSVWDISMYEDVDSDGRILFDEILAETTEHAMILFGRTAFGFDDKGEISDQIHYAVIRDLCFDPAYPKEGAALLKTALRFFGKKERVYAFFHYFGMSACARHGKLHESYPHVHQLLLENGFTVEHENVYYSRTLTDEATEQSAITLQWQDTSPGDCRNFTALDADREIGWGQIHFLPQGTIAYLRWIYIDSNVQHRGYGTAVMHQLLAELYRLGIRRFDTDTAVDNTAAQDYYSKTGFTNRGITRSYYTK